MKQFWKRTFCTHLWEHRAEKCRDAFVYECWRCGRVKVVYWR